MIVDFFRHGTGLSKGCLNYLLGEDQNREHAQVLNGDVGLTAQLIDSSPFTKKYTSGCLSFYEHDLSEQDKKKIMRDFEACLFPGLDQDQYQILWVEHRDKFNQDKLDPNKLPTDKNELDKIRRLELNFVIPNVELSTGKRLQPFYAPVDLDRVDLFKKITNKKYRLYDPDAPEHRQLFIDKKNLPSNVKDFKSQLHDRIYRAVAEGDIADRQTLVQWLESQHIRVTRQVKQSISIENPFNDAKRPIRLEGEIYEQSFRAIGEYRQEVQRRIKTYRGTARKRYRTDVRNYQKQLAHKSQYHSIRYSGVGRKDRSEHSSELQNDRQQDHRAPTLARIEVEPFTAVKRANTARRTEGSQHSRTEEAEYFKYHADFNRCYFAYCDFTLGLQYPNPVQRTGNSQQRDLGKASDNRPLEQIRGEFEYQYMCVQRQQESTTVYSDQYQSRELAGWHIHGSNGVLIDDRTRNTVVEDYRRTTAAITATTKTIAGATADFRVYAEKGSERLIRSINGNRERSEQFETATRIIRDNTAAILRAREEYSELYRADQWQGQGNEPDHSRQSGRIRENIERTTFSIETIRASTAELTRNLSGVEASFRAVEVKKLERQKVVKDSLSKGNGRTLDY
ncbi:relaxase/mobilization nuclease domain-containing protein [Acinetobacter nectaris]|uniref:relaxase/mobilization nuclease domain-containing protein n=1 Tax=Acinetobacter nectaris TaxID=1219382 RepID=UPI001F32684A|nr:relaxase/mobilization nuclease domain-containing protein [Acinetobacter nectaris]MCF9047182.1 relaxase/mobilization nuclease domain-containing protein [Acinetobacter nectaris]